tara:strand:- start:227 stop:574 length:348 start_codon:yes stop_codon:yes gene_type:complete
MAQHRPVNDRIAETLAQLATLQAKANKEAVNEDSRIVAIDQEIVAINNSMLKFNRWNTEWEQKVEDFTARVAEWKLRGQEASAKIKEANISLASLKESRRALSIEVSQEIMQDVD